MPKAGIRAVVTHPPSFGSWADQTARRREAGIPQRPVESTTTPIVNSLACPSQQSPTTLTWTSRSATFYGAGLWQKNSPVRGAIPETGNAQVSANWALPRILAESSKKLAALGFSAPTAGRQRRARAPPWTLATDGVRGQSERTGHRRRRNLFGLASFTHRSSTPEEFVEHRPQSSGGLQRAPLGAAYFSDRDRRQ